MLNCNIILQKN